MGCVSQTGATWRSSVASAREYATAVAREAARAAEESCSVEKPACSRLTASVSPKWKDKKGDYTGEM